MTQFSPDTRLEAKAELMEALGLIPVDTNICVAELCAIAINNLHESGEIPTTEGVKYTWS